MRRMAITSVWLLSSALSLVGCDTFTFDVDGSEAGIKVVNQPDGFGRPGFGTAVAGVAGTLADGKPVSRLMATEGEDSAGASFPVWDGDELSVGAALFDNCVGTEACGLGYGKSVAGLPVWTGNDGSVQRMCMMVPELDPAGSPRVRVLCETRTGTAELRGAPAPGDSDWGASIVGLDEGSPAGVALVGAPQDGDGRVYRYPAGRAAAEPLDLSAAGITGGARLGAHLAAARLGDGRTLVVAAAPGDGRVVAAAVGSAGAGVTTDVLGCFDAPADAPGFGGAVAAGDLDGDGEPEVVVGRDPSAGGSARVWVYETTTLTGAVGCTVGASPSPERTIACGDVPLDPDFGSVPCDGSGFGATVATGDLDADGMDEILVGAPAATVDETAAAGALFVVPGGSSGPDPSAGRVLFDGSPDEDARLGTSLATVRTHLGTPQERDEPVAGAPGAEQVLIFFCSGLESDRPQDATGPRCGFN